MYYHLHHYVQEDDLSVGFHIEEAVYARRYYGYGLDGEQFDRNNVFVSIENRIKQITTDPIITVHMVASPDIIESRMSALKDHPEHTNTPLQVADIEDVMADYQYFISKSDIGPVVRVDTSIDSPEETLEKVVALLEPYFTKTDLERIENHKRQ
jgi:deoxyadenosine/deoxycytidine kinase